MGMILLFSKRFQKTSQLRRNIRSPLMKIKMRYAKCADMKNTKLSLNHFIANPYQTLIKSTFYWHSHPILGGSLPGPQSGSIFKTEKKVKIFHLCENRDSGFLVLHGAYLSCLQYFRCRLCSVLLCFRLLVTYPWQNFLMLILPEVIVRLF